MKPNTDNDFKQIEQQFDYSKIVAVVGVVSIISFYIFYRNFNARTLEFFHLHYVFYIGLSLLFLWFQDIFNAYRIHILSNKKISVRNGYISAILFQFANAITPPFIGNTAFPFIVFKKFGLNNALSSFVLVANIVLDQLMFLCFIPILYFIFGDKNIFGFAASTELHSIKLFALYGYVSFIAVCSIVIFIVFIAPRFFISLFACLFSLPIFKFVKKTVLRFLFTLYRLSFLVKNISFSTWVKSILCTVSIWFFKFCCGAVLLFPFLKNGTLHLSIVRQYFLTVLQLATPTPGGAGTAEYSFLLFFKDIIPQAESVVLAAFFWRFITYYLYIVIGIIVFSYWVKKYLK